MSLENRLSKAEKETDEIITAQRLRRISDAELIELGELASAIESGTATEAMQQRANEIWGKTL